MRSEPLATEVLQIGMIKLYKNLSSFNFNSTIETFAMRIVINSCYDKFRETKRDMVELDQNLILHSGRDSDLKMDLEYALDRLPQKMREVFILFAIEGFKQSEIGEILTISEGTVKAHIYQAKLRLREILRGKDGV